jgi:putative molybdopterin biosynthesis protein
MKKRQVYLSMKSLDEAKELFHDHFSDLPRRTQELPVQEALGRVTAEPVFARFSSPTFHSAAMDGIAVQAAETYGTTERHPRIFTVGRNAVWINTGQMLPQGFDSVIMVEKLHEIDEDHLEIRSPSYPWQNVRKVGEDIVSTELLLPQNHRIRPYDMGALISAGVYTVSVWAKPKVAIIPTGSELVQPDHVREWEAAKDRIIEYNSVVLAGLVRECGAVPEVYDIVSDEEKKIAKALSQAVESDADMVIVNAGSSAGSEDYTVHAIRDMGEVLVHGVAMMPGKPTILGALGGKPVVGNPGYAVSSVLSFEQFVMPLLHRLQGSSPPRRNRVRVRPTRDIPSKLGLEEFLRVNIGKVGPTFVATPLARAAGSITTLTKAEGIIRISALSEGISRKEEVEAELLVGAQDLENTVVVIGSHDITIDILADEIRRTGRNIRISSGNVGSLGGLMALRRGTCHGAGSHLLDPDTGEYNITYIQRYLQGLPVRVFRLVLRDQGLMVAKGNPKGIQGIQDLMRSDLTFVNRQAGSGTRVLLDYHLNRAGIQSEAICGYDHEEFTHMAVAVDVLSGAADCGMGIFAAARALALDFIPVAREEYDLVIPELMLSLPLVQEVLETVGSVHFRERVLDLGGYDPARSGEIKMHWDGGDHGRA